MREGATVPSAEGFAACRAADAREPVAPVAEGLTALPLRRFEMAHHQAMHHQR
jgi:hypothetical protein